MEEHRTSNPTVVGSSPAGGIGYVKKQEPNRVHWGEESFSQ